jgi:hypothetical protein
MSNVDFEFLPHRAALLPGQDNTLDVLGRAAAPGARSRSIQQTCLAHALGNPFGVRGILEWQPTHMIFQ